VLLRAAARQCRWGQAGADRKRRKKMETMGMAAQVRPPLRPETSDLSLEKAAPEFIIRDGQPAMGNGEVWGVPRFLCAGPCAPMRMEADGLHNRRLGSSICAETVSAPACFAGLVHCSWLYLSGLIIRNKCPLKRQPCEARGRPEEALPRQGGCVHAVAVMEGH
jgi:hypothetical protein